MRRFHIVAVTPDLEKALAVQTSAGWLLPCLDDDPFRALPAQVHALLARIAGGGEIVHEAPLAFEDERAGVTHKVAVALIRCGASGSSELRRHRIADLMSGRALLPLQRRALATSMARLEKPVAPFDSGDRVAAALAWVDEKIATHTGAGSRSMHRHRCTRYEYVVACESNTGAMYFKGGRERVADEAALTQLLWTLSPGHFPETVAVDPVGDRWLYRELPGDLLIDPRLTIALAAAAVDVLASVQTLVLQETSVAAHLANRRMNGTGLFERADRIICDVLQAADATALLDRWHAAADHIASIGEAVDALRLPQTLVLSDFWGRNIVQTPTGFGFIDLEQSYWTYPFLSLWKFFAEVTRHLPADAHAQARATLQQGFIEAWRDVVSIGTMARAFDYLPVLGRLFSTLLELRELDLEEREFGEALPGGYRARRLAPSVEACIEVAKASAITARGASAAPALLHRRR